MFYIAISFMFECGNLVGIFLMFVFVVVSYLLIVKLIYDPVGTSFCFMG